MQISKSFVKFGSSEYGDVIGTAVTEFRKNKIKFRTKYSDRTWRTVIFVYKKDYERALDVARKARLFGKQGIN